MPGHLLMGPLLPSLLIAHRAAALFFLLALSACSPAPTVTAPCGEGEPELLLGAANMAGVGFFSLAGQDKLPLIHGPQGGFHVWLQLRARGLCADGAVLQRSTRRGDGAVITEVAEIVDLVGASDPALNDQGWRELPAGRPAILCPTDESVVGAPIVLHATLKDSAERTASAEATVVPACPQGPDEANCLMQCAMSP